MAVDTNTLIWLFPIMFMFHDFEEIILFEPWLRKNAAEIRGRIPNRAPTLVTGQIDGVLKKSTAEFAFPVSLIFSLTCISAFLATVYGQYGFFLIACGTFFMHGFMHLGQAIVLRRYVPAVITSTVFVIPYGLIIFWRLVSAGIVNMPGLLIYFLIAAALVVPFILVMLKAGEFLYRQTLKLLIHI